MPVITLEEIAKSIRACKFYGHIPDAIDIPNSFTCDLISVENLSVNRTDDALPVIRCTDGEQWEIARCREVEA